jgi:hypothetical protein
LTMTMLLLASVTSFSPESSFSRRSMIRPSISTLSRVCPSKPSRLSVSVSSDVEIENLPELGNDGVYHVATEAQHK